MSFLASRFSAPNPSGFYFHFFRLNSYMCCMLHISCFSSLKIAFERPPCVTGSRDTKQKSLAAKMNVAKHVFDVLIPNWASNKHQLAGILKRIRNYKYPAGRKLSHRETFENRPENSGTKPCRTESNKQTANSVIKSNCLQTLLPDPFPTLSECASAF